MSINKAENQLENKLVNDIENLKRDMREIKTKQPIGADVLQVAPLPTSGALFAGPVTVASGSSVTFTVTFTPDSQTLTIWNVLFSLYVDADATANLFPSGSALTSAQRNLRVAGWFDWSSSSDSTNMRAYKIHVRNEDAASHDYYIRIRAYLPTIGATAA